MAFRWLYAGSVLILMTDSRTSTGVALTDRFSAARTGVPTADPEPCPSLPSKHSSLLFSIVQTQAGLVNRRGTAFYEDEVTFEGFDDRTVGRMFL